MRDNDSFDLLWVGKFDFRKQLRLALNIMASLRGFPCIRLHVLGGGNAAENAFYKGLADKLNVAGTVVFHGRLAHENTLAAMAKADALLFTSIADETSTVVLEAIGACLPVVCFNACGFGPLATPDIGRTVPVTNPAQSVSDFRNAILELYAQPELLRSMSAACKDKSRTLTWDSKARQMVEIYEKISTRI